MRDPRLSKWEMFQGTFLMLMFACLLLSSELYKKYKVFEKSNSNITIVSNSKSV